MYNSFDTLSDHIFIWFYIYIFIQKQLIARIINQNVCLFHFMIICFILFSPWVFPVFSTNFLSSISIKVLCFSEFFFCIFVFFACYTLSCQLNVVMLLSYYFMTQASGNCDWVIYTNISILSNEARNNCGIKTLCVSKIPQASSCSAFIVTAQKCFSWIVNISRRIQSIGLRRIPLFLDGTPNGYFVYCPIKSAIYLLDFLQFSNFFTLFRFFFCSLSRENACRNSIAIKWT